MQKSKFQFLNPYLEDLKFTINDEFVLNGNKLEMQNEFGISVKRKENEKREKVILTLEINKAKDNMPFELEIKVASDFKWDDSLSDEKVEYMLNTNAPALLLSYMRPIVANITNASKIPAYNLPFINFVK